MAKLTVNGKTVTVDDSFLELPREQQEATVNEIAAQLAAQEQKGGAKNAPPQAAPQSKTKIDQDTLQYDRKWLEASRTWYRAQNGKEFKGTNAELAEEGISAMRWFNNNTLSMTKAAAQLRNAPPEVKSSFLYMMDTFDKTDWTWGGVAEAAGIQAIDPANFATAAISIFSGGTAAPAAIATEQAAVQATKAGIRAMLKEGLKIGLKVGAENAIISGGQSVIKQEARVQAGGQDEIDFGQAAADAATGFVAGTVLGTGVGTIATGVRASRAAKSAAPVVDDAAAVVSRDIAEAQAPTPTMASNLPSEAPQSVDNAYSNVTVPDAPEMAVAAPEGTIAPNVTDAAPLPLNTADNALPTVSALDAPMSAADNIVDDGVSMGTRILNAVREVADSGGRIFIRNQADLADASATAVQLIKSLNINSVRDAAEVLRIAGVNGPTEQVLKDAVMKAASALTVEIPEDVVARLTPEQASDLADVQNAIAQLDLQFSSATGRDLGNRAGNSVLTGENRTRLTVPDVLKELNLPDTPENRRAALGEIAQRVKTIQAQAAATKEAKTLESKIAQAFAHGDMDKAAQLGAERAALLASIEKSAIENMPFGKRMKAALMNGANMLATWVQSVLLGPDSFGRNIIPSMVKTVYKPFLNATSKGMGKAARSELTMTYHTLWRVKGEAARAAIAYWRYGQDVVSHTPDKLLEGATGRIPGAIPTLGLNKVTSKVPPQIPVHDIVTAVPRAMGAVDQFFRVAHYRAFIEGRSVEDAIRNAEARGLSKDARNDLIAKTVQKNLNASYDTNFDSVHIVDFLREQGVRRGYTEEALDRWVVAELEKNKDLFKQASNETALNYVNDLLFSRTLSGEGTASKLVRGYQQNIHTNPFARILLNPYFLTPIRVFEEGFRLTPLVQFITPHFIADLRGLRGNDRQVRAIGEMMLGQALTMEIMYKYASGEITGAGPSDPKERKAWLAAGNKPYSIKVFGETYSYRAYDPFSTPFKILVNALDNYRYVEARNARDEFENQGETEVFGVTFDNGKISKIAANIGVGTLAVGQAIQDTGMLEGFAQLVDVGKAFLNPEENEAPMLKLVMDKMRVFVPRMIGKVENIQGDGIIRSPRTIEQYIKATVNPSSDELPAQYDAMGIRRANGLGWWSMIGVDKVVQTEEEKGITPQQREIAKVLMDITIATKKDFSLPVKPSLEGMEAPADLRTVYMPDGKKTQYDRYGEIYRSLNVTDQLAFVINEWGGTIATKDQDGSLTMRVDNVVKANQRKAFAILMSEITGIKEKHIEKKLRQREDFFGANEIDLKPYN